MASTLLFALLPQTFNAATVAGSGTVTRWTYTVPAGKRAIVRHCSIVIAANANAANTTQATIRASIGGVLNRLLSLDGSASANQASKEIACACTLYAGDTLNGLSVNTGAGNVVMVIEAQIEEYG